MEKSNREIHLAYQTLTSELKKRNARGVDISIYDENHLKIELTEEKRTIWLGYKDGFGYFISWEFSQEGDRYFDLDDKSISNIMQLIPFDNDKTNTKRNNSHDVDISHDNDNNIGKITVYINEQISLREFINILNAFDVIYDELYFIDASFEQLVKLKSKYNRNPTDSIEEILRIGCEKEINNKNIFSDQNVVLRIGRGGSNSPWWIELIGRLNPLRTIEKMILIMRDWKTEIEKNKIKNKLALIALRSKILDDAMKEIDLIKNINSFMLEAKIDKDRVHDFVFKRIDTILSNTMGPEDLDSLYPNNYLSNPQYVLLPTEYKTKKSSEERLELEGK